MRHQMFRHLSLGISTLKFWRGSLVPWVSKLAVGDHAIPGIVPFSPLYFFPAGRISPKSPALAVFVAHPIRSIAHLSIVQLKPDKRLIPFASVNVAYKTLPGF
jgi:hypothetical protein